jgi:hypothetical protein
MRRDEASPALDLRPIERIPPLTISPKIAPLSPGRKAGALPYSVLTINQRGSH